MGCFKLGHPKYSIASERLQRRVMDRQTDKRRVPSVHSENDGSHEAGCSVLSQFPPAGLPGMKAKSVTQRFAMAEGTRRSGEARAARQVQLLPSCKRTGTAREQFVTLQNHPAYHLRLEEQRLTHESFMQHPPDLGLDMRYSPSVWFCSRGHARFHRGSRDEAEAHSGTPGTAPRRER